MNYAFAVGNLPVWRHPIRLRRTMRGVDTLSGDYKCATTTTLAPGDAVPGYAGMIIRDLEEISSGISHEYSIEAEGSIDSSNPTKIISRSETRNLGPVFESFVERKLSWLCSYLAITGDSATDIITTATAHGYSDGQKVVLLDMSGGTGLTAQTATTIGTVYFVRDKTSTTFKLATTAGGSAINFTADITSGKVIAAEFCPGTVHPDYPGMYLNTVTINDDYHAWKTADCEYVGKMWAKPYHRVITCNGQQFSSSSPITIGLTGGWEDPLYSTFHLPIIQVTDLVLETSAPTTASIPTIATPSSAPSIQSISLDGADDLFTWNYPYGWSLVDASHQDTLNSGITLFINRYVYQYIWPKSFK